MILEGFLTVLSPECLIVMVIGTTIGIMFGSIPGLTANMAVALCLPMTYSMTSSVGISMLIALYIGSISGGLIAAILINIPGTPASVATCFDGAPMAKKGEAGKALGAGLLFSFMGTIFSIVALIIIAPQLAKVALRFGPHEYFAVGLFSLTMIGCLISGSIIKGLIACAFGLAMSLVGAAPIGGAVRFTFGFSELVNGFNSLPVLIGLFAVSEIFQTVTSPLGNGEKLKTHRFEMKGFGITLAEFKSQIGVAVQSFILGLGIGILPGIGGGTSNILSYTLAKQTSKHPEKFGTGILDGVVASETANNASIGGAMIPLLTLGIPGDTVTAMLLGGLMIHGISPGPLLFTNYGTFVYGIFFAMIICSIMMIVIMRLGMPVFAKVLSVPRYVLLPVVLALCCVGCYGLNNRIFDVWCMLIFGVVGFVMNKLKIPFSPLILGFILGSMIEQNLIRGLQYSGGSFSSFIEKPISLVFLLISLGVVIFTVVRELKLAREKSKNNMV